MTDTGIPRAYTVKELAKILKVTPRTIYTYIKGGKIQAVKIGSQWMVTAEEIQRIFKGQ